MMRFPKFLTPVILLVAVFILGFRAHIIAQGLTPKYFAACVDAGKGTLYNLVESVGSAPAAPSCKQGDSLVRWADREYSAGAGLTLTGTEFSVNFGGNGSAQSAARSDHAHDDLYVNEGQPSSISSAMLVDGAVTTAKIADSAVTSANLGDGAVTTAKIANDASEASRFLSWFNYTTPYDFTATGPNSPHVIDTDLTVTVPAGKAYYYLIKYEGRLVYYYAERLSQGFYASWSAKPLGNGVSLTQLPSTFIVSTGYRVDWVTNGGSWYWSQPYNTDWVVRLGEGTYSLSILIGGYSDDTMSMVHFDTQQVQVMRLL